MGVKRERVKMEEEKDNKERETKRSKLNESDSDIEFLGEVNDEGTLIKNEFQNTAFEFDDNDIEIIYSDNDSEIDLKVS